MRATRYPILALVVLSALAQVACSRNALAGSGEAPPPAGSDVQKLVSAGHNAEQTDYAPYPDELHGLWVGLSVPCPERGGYLDTELILEISSNEIAGYEEVLRATKVSAAPPPATSWRIETLIDVGPDGVFSEHGPITYTISGGELSVIDGRSAERYKKCHRWGGS